MKLKALWANEHFFGLTERGYGGEMEEATVTQFVVSI